MRVQYLQILSIGKYWVSVLRNLSSGSILFPEIRIFQRGVWEGGGGRVCIPKLPALRVQRAEGTWASLFYA